jgi:hypothetical protein
MMPFVAVPKLFKPRRSMKIAGAIAEYLSAEVEIFSLLGLGFFGYCCHE